MCIVQAVEMMMMCFAPFANARQERGTVLLTFRPTYLAVHANCECVIGLFSVFCTFYIGPFVDYPINFSLLRVYLDKIYQYIYKDSGLEF